MNMSTTILTDLTKMKTGDLIDAIHDVACGMNEAEDLIAPEEYKLLFDLVDELRSRSLVAEAKGKPLQ